MRPALPLLALTLILVPMAPAQMDDVDVVRVTIDGVVSQGTTIHVERGLDLAEELGVPLLIQLDTPGGLVAATLDIDDLLAQSDVPVLTYVGPGGGTYAASAGTFILLMGHVSGMADGSTIGSAQAVQSSPEGDTVAASDKVQNFLVERIRSIAERNGRDPDLAERFITENLNMNADEALSAGLIDQQGDDADAFLSAIAGTEVIAGDDSWSLATAGATIHDVQPGALAAFVDIIGNPQVAFVLVLAGTYGVIFGIANGGTYVPEVLGALLLILGFIGLGLFTTSTAGVILLVIGLLFLVVEMFTPTNGILTGVGVVALILSAIFLVQEPLLPAGVQRWFIGTGVSVSLLLGALVTLAITVALRSHHRPVHDALLGTPARVIDTLDPKGRVLVNGEVWHAETDIGPIAVDSDVVICGREGLTLHVVPEAIFEEE